MLKVSKMCVETTWIEIIGKILSKKSREMRKFSKFDVTNGDIEFSNSGLRRLYSVSFVKFCEGLAGCCREFFSRNFFKKVLRIICRIFVYMYFFVCFIAFWDISILLLFFTALIEKYRFCKGQKYSKFVNFHKNFVTVL